MTEHDLMALKYISAQIERLKERIEEMESEDGLGAVNMDGMPHGTEPGKPVERLALARVALHEKLSELLAKKIEKEIEIREYIESVEDAQVKYIMEMRYIYLMDWYEIAAEMEEISGREYHRTAAYKKVQRYLDKHECVTQVT